MEIKILISLIAVLILFGVVKLYVNDTATAFKENPGVKAGVYLVDINAVTFNDHTLIGLLWSSFMNEELSIDETWHIYS